MSTCNVAEVLAMLLTGDKKDKRPIMWYNMAMQQDNAGISLNNNDVKMKALSELFQGMGDKLEALMSDIGSYHGTIDPKSKSTQNIQDFMRDIKSKSDDPDGKQLIKALVLSGKLNNDPNANSRITLRELAKAVFESFVNINIAGNVGGPVDSKTDSKTDTKTDSKIELSGGAYTKKMKDQLLKISEDILQNLENNLMRLNDQLKKSKGILNLENIYNELIEAINSAYKRSYAEKHTTLANPQSKELYNYIRSHWKSMGSNLKNFIRSLFNVMKLKEDSRGNLSWVECENAFEENVADPTKYRLNLKRAGTIGNEVRPPIFASSIPVLVYVNANDLNIGNAVRAMENMKKHELLEAYLNAYTKPVKPSGVDSFSFKNLNFKNLYDKILKSCMNGDKEVDNVSGKGKGDGKYRIVAGKLYKHTGERWVPNDLDVANLSADRHCYKLGVAPAYCNAVWACLMSSNDSSNLDDCQQVITDQKAFDGVTEEHVEYMHPYVVDKSLKRLGFRAVERYDAFLKKKFYVYEDVQAWLAHIKENPDAVSVTDTMIKGHLIGSIANNASMLKFLGLMVDYVRRHPEVACSKNNEAEQSGETKVMTQLAIDTKREWYKPVKFEGQLNVYRMKQSPTTIIKPIIRTTANLPNMAFNLSQSGLFNRGLFNSGNKIIIRQKGGNGDKKSWCLQGLEKAYKQQKALLEGVGKKLGPSVVQKIETNLKALEPLSKAIEKSVLEMDVLLTITNSLADYSDLQLDQDMIDKILGQHQDLLGSYTRKTLRVNNAVGQMAKIYIEQKQRKITDPPAEPEKYKIEIAH